GIHLAANAMTIFFARILWAFEILPEIDVNGDPLPVDRDATVGTIFSFPAPFECRFVPRSLEKVALLRSEWDRLSDELLGEDQNYKKVVVPGKS
ncbi:hypothetical protein JQN64_28235, partial [Escherichia coli]|nr:hypothetical protein [Escherichia coli]